MNAYICQPRAHLLSKSRTLPSKSTFSCPAASPAAPGRSSAAALAPRQILGSKSPSRPFLPSYLPKNNVIFHQKNQQKDTTTTAHAAPAAAATTAAAGGQTLIFGRAHTGIPLLELFKTMTLAEAALESSLQIGIIVIAVFFGNRNIPFISSKVEAALGKLGKTHKRKTRGLFAQTVGSIVAASEAPCRALLPWFGFAYGATVLSCLGELAVTRLGGTIGSTAAVTQGIAKGAFNSMSKEGAKFCMTAAGVKLVEILTEIAQLMQDAYEVVAIIFAAWFFINLKNQLVKNIMANTATSSSDFATDREGLARIIVPISSLINWGVVCATILISLTAVGIDVKPLLALGSVSGLAIGFAAQSTVANVVSAFSLYTSRPFIAGDRVQLKTMTGSHVIAGTVEKILPLHTILKTDNGTPIFIHNKDVAGTLLVINESRIVQSASTHPLPTLDTTITVRYRDVDKVGAIQRQTTEWMKAHPDMLPGATCICNLTGFDHMGAVLSIKATLKRDASGRKSQVFTEILLFAENCVRRNGGYLAMSSDVELPPPLSP
jgi:small-conductance mechanosensitive channel